MPRKKTGLTKGSVNSPELVEPGDNSKFVQKNLMIMQLGEDKVDLDCPDEVKERISQYFQLMIELDSRPTMTGLAMALGYNHNRIHEIINNLPLGGKTGTAYKLYGQTTSSVPKESRDLISAAVDVMKSLWEDYMQNGKIYPACGIFLGKNFYGMKDEVEHVVTANNNPLDEYSAEDIAQRYIQDKNG
jgi:hypothetical protein